MGVDPGDDLSPRTGRAAVARREGPLLRPGLVLVRGHPLPLAAGVGVELDRVGGEGPQRFHPRWLVKDLGTLAYSAQRAGATRTDLMKFYKVCFQKTKLNAADKRLIGRILQRTARLHARLPKYDVIWDANSR